MIAIAIASFREALKKKIILLIGLLSLIYLVLYSLLVFYILTDVKKYSSDSISLFSQFAAVISLLGFYFSSMLIAFLTIMASIGAISSEIESGIIHAVITKPLKRVEYLLGKFLGLAFLIVIYSVFMYLAVIIIPLFMGGPSLNVLGIMSLSKGLFLFVFQPLTILSLCIFGSVYFKTLNNGILVVSIYILGTIGGMVEQIGSLIGSENMVKFGILSSLISPFDVIYRKMISTIFAKFGISAQMLGPMFLSKSTPSFWMMLYAVLFSAALIFFAVKRFNKKDIS